jgi:hypothetical protein
MDLKDRSNAVAAGEECGRNLRAYQSHEHLCDAALSLLRQLPREVRDEVVEGACEAIKGGPMSTREIARSELTGLADHLRRTKDQNDAVMFMTAVVCARTKEIAEVAAELRGFSGSQYEALRRDAELVPDEDAKDYGGLLRARVTHAVRATGETARALYVTALAYLEHKSRERPIGVAMRQHGVAMTRGLLDAIDEYSRSSEPV